MCKAPLVRSQGVPAWVPVWVLFKSDATLQYRLFWSDNCCPPCDLSHSVIISDSGKPLQCLHLSHWISHSPLSKLFYFSPLFCHFCLCAPPQPFLPLLRVSIHFKTFPFLQLTLFMFTLLLSSDFFSSNSCIRNWNSQALFLFSLLSCIWPLTWLSITSLNVAGLSFSQSLHSIFWHVSLCHWLLIDRVAHPSSDLLVDCLVVDPAIHQQHCLMVYKWPVKKKLVKIKIDIR